MKAIRYSCFLIALALAVFAATVSAQTTTTTQTTSTKTTKTKKDKGVTAAEVEALRAAIAAQEAALAAQQQEIRRLQQELHGKDQSVQQAQSAAAEAASKASEAQAQASQQQQAVGELKSDVADLKTNVNNAATSIQETQKAIHSEIENPLAHSLQRRDDNAGRLPGGRNGAAVASSGIGHQHAIQLAHHARCFPEQPVRVFRIWASVTRQLAGPGKTEERPDRRLLRGRLSQCRCHLQQQ